MLSSAEVVHSSSLSQMLAVSSKLMTTELPDAPVTRQNRSLQGRAARTEPVLIRLRNDDNGFCPIDDGPAGAVAKG